MDSSEIMAGSIAYIEQHLRQELTVELLADMAGFSPYYFCRLFTLHADMPVMEYIRRRRLAFAASDICAGKRILDVALDYGFESHTGFAKAFRRIYGYSPDEYRRRVSPHRPPAPNPLAAQPEFSQTGVPQVRLVQQPGFYIAGKVLQTTDDLCSIAQMPALWKDMRQLQEEENRIYAMAQPKQHGEYYISFPVDTGRYRLVTGVKVDDPDALPDGLYVDWVGPGLYGIFSSPPVRGRTAFAEAVVQTWRYIYDCWLPQNPYGLNPEGLDYEYYDERCHGSGPLSMDICVPLIPL